MNDFHLLTLNAILKTSQLSMISMVCLLFLGNVPDEYSFLCREDSPPLSFGAPPHEFSFLLPIIVSLKRSIYK